MLRLNPNIDDVWFEFEEAKSSRFDRLFLLDDEMDALKGVDTLAAVSITGAFLKDGQPTYTEDAAEWFDMGLHSRFGKERADALKKLNKRSHCQIYSMIFGVENVTPEFYLDGACHRWAETQLPQVAYRVGVNPYSGGRWPSKKLLPKELEKLIVRVLDGSTSFGVTPAVILIGAGDDYKKNQDLCVRLARENLRAVCTDHSVQHLAAIISELNYLISSDSLALHLAIAQRVPFTAFFSPTSAIEIDDWGIGTKVCSTAADYCSYRKDADNTTITADRIIEVVASNRRISNKHRR